MNNLSPELLAQLYSQESSDPFLTLLTLSHDSFDDIRLVNNTENVTSNGLVYQSFPFKLTLPVDDGETSRQVTIDFDNVGLELISEIRTVTDFIDVKLDMVLASLPDETQIEIGELKIQSISYNSTKVSAVLFLDNFLNTQISSERYSPTNFPGMF